MNWYRKHRYPTQMAETVELIYGELGLPTDTPITPMLYSQLGDILHKNYNIQLVCYHVIGLQDQSIDLAYTGVHTCDTRAYILVDQTQKHCRLIINIKNLFKSKFCDICLKVGGTCYCTRKPCAKCGTVVCTRLNTNSNDTGFYLCNQCSIAFDSKLCFDLHKNHTCQEVRFLLIFVNFSIVNTMII